jgi:hypothetical protein
VIDAVDGDIYGVLFAYSASLREGYIILFQDILENIADVTHASKIGLPSAENPSCEEWNFYWRHCVTNTG